MLLPWPVLQHSIPSIMLAPYPTPTPGWDDSSLEASFDYMQSLVNAIRKLRSDYGLTKQRPTVYVSCSDSARSGVLSGLCGEAATLSTSSDVQVLEGGQSAPAGCSVAIVDDATTISMLLKVRAGSLYHKETYGWMQCSGQCAAVQSDPQLYSCGNVIVTVVGSCFML